jgi:hypothetical protein
VCARACVCASSRYVQMSLCVPHLPPRTCLNAKRNSTLTRTQDHVFAGSVKDSHRGHRLALAYIGTVILLLWCCYTSLLYSLYFSPDRALRWIVSFGITLLVQW